jgi:hypothetical membrane protein
MNDETKLGIAGTLLFLSGVIIIMGIITGEIYYPTGYSTHHNDISDLGGTRPPNSIVYQPSAAIFDTTMLVTGLMIFAASIMVHLHFKKWLSTIPLSILGLGIFGVGLFPGHVEFWHGLFSFITFVAGGVACIMAFKIFPAPYRYIGICFGVISLVFLFRSSSFIPHLGSGGTERWVAYPVVLWLIGFGGYLLGLKHKISNHVN